MRSLLHRVHEDIKSSWQERLLYGLIFGAVFFVFSYYIPSIYYKYIDQRDYIKFTQPIGFGKKVYAPCETQTAITHIEIDLDSNITIFSRLYLTLSQKDNSYQIIKEYYMDSFLKSQPDIQTFISKQPLPCDLKPGIYFYRGVLTYNIRGVSKTTSFFSDSFSIEGGGEQ